MRKKIEELLLRNDPYVNLFQWNGRIESAIKQSASRGLIQINEIHITESELQTIGQVTGRMRQKFLFTILCLAKYYDKAYNRDGHWINIDVGQIGKMANLPVGNVKRGLLINDFVSAGLITKSGRLDSTSLQVHFIDDASETKIRITDFRNLGYQYDNYLHGGYIECIECGLTVKRTGTRQKYCESCARTINAANVLRRYHEKTA